MSNSWVMCSGVAALMACGGLSLSSSHAATLAGQGTWESTLQARDLDGDHSTIEAYYDTTLNITWLADANFAKTSGGDADGQMTWQRANAWLSTLEVGGVSGWRHPNVAPINGQFFDNVSTYTGESDFGYNISSPTHELAHLFYVTLGNKSSCEFIYGSVYNCGTLNFGTFNDGPFKNVQQALYWTGGISSSDYRWAKFIYAFDTRTGHQGIQIDGQHLNTWAVHSGDVGVAVVPEPSTMSMWMLGVLAAIGSRFKRNASSKVN